MSRRTLAIATPAMSQAPFLEYDPKSGRWRAWTAFDKNATSGTYFDLYATGAVERVTIARNGEVANTINIMPAMKG